MRILRTAPAWLALFFPLGTVAWGDGDAATISQIEPVAIESPARAIVPIAASVDEMSAMAGMPLYSAWDLPPGGFHSPSWLGAPHANLWHNYCADKAACGIRHDPHRNWYPLVHLKCRMHTCTHTILHPAVEVVQVFGDLFGFRPCCTHGGNCGCSAGYAHAHAHDHAHEAHAASDDAATAQPRPVYTDEPQPPVVPEDEDVAPPSFEPVPLELNNSDLNPSSDPESTPPRVPRNVIPESKKTNSGEIPLSTKESSRRTVAAQPASVKLSDYIK